MKVISLEVIFIEKQKMYRDRVSEAIVVIKCKLDTTWRAIGRGRDKLEGDGEIRYVSYRSLCCMDHRVDLQAACRWIQLVQKSGRR